MILNHCLLSNSNFADKLKNAYTLAVVIRDFNPRPIGLQTTQLNPNRTACSSLSFPLYQRKTNWCIGCECKTHNDKGENGAPASEEELSRHPVVITGVLRESAVTVFKLGISDPESKELYNQ